MTLSSESMRFLLRGLRQRLGLTQSEMAEAMGVKLRTLEDLEAGRWRVREIHLNAARWVQVAAAQRAKAAQVTTKEALIDRITDYLANGGLFNPEAMSHEAVRRLLIDCREGLASLQPTNPSPAPYAVEGRYRKKPVVIEAKQFIGGPDSAVECMSFAGLPETAYVHLDGGVEYLHIGTMEGIMCVHVGDWIIRGVQGEFYPCKPDIFEATYEPALTAAIGAGEKSIDGDIIVEAVDDRICLILCSGGDGLTAILDSARATELRDKLDLAIGAGGQAVAPDAIYAELRAYFERYPTEADEHLGMLARKLSALSQPHPADERVVEALRRMLRLFDDQGNLIADFAQIQGAISNGYQALSEKEGRS